MVILCFEQVKEEAQQMLKSLDGNGLPTQEAVEGMQYTLCTLKVTHATYHNSCVTTTVCCRLLLPGLALKGVVNKPTTSAHPIGLHRLAADELKAHDERKCNMLPQRIKSNLPAEAPPIEALVEDVQAIVTHFCKRKHDLPVEMSNLAALKIRFVANRGIDSMGLDCWP